MSRANDPYWALAYINGQWYFSDTCGTAFMGDGNEEIQLIRPITVPNVWASNET
jgi:hypothetical protein